MSMIVTLSGMSTSGKTTFAKALSEHPQFRKPVSVTTRAMREGEVEGVDYHFVSRETFEAMIEAGELLEYEASHSAMYGTSAAEVARILDQGLSPMPILEPEGVISMQAIAEQRNLPFLSIYIEADIQVIMERFFERLDAELSSKGQVDYAKHSQRLQTMLTQEMHWPQRTQWGLVLSNLHLEGRFDQALTELAALSEQGLQPQPTLPVMHEPVTHWGLDELADLLKKHHMAKSTGARFWSALNAAPEKVKAQSMEPEVAP